MLHGIRAQKQDSGEIGEIPNKVCSLVDNIVSMLISCSSSLCYDYGGC